MQRFILKTGILIAVLLLPMCILSFYIDGYSDPFYLRTTTPKQENLILGTSRAAQGISPNVLNQITNIDFYNYAFTIAHSPYGEVYYKSTIQKLNRTPNSTHILCVDPWAISSKFSSTGQELFPEDTRVLNQVSSVSSKPNFKYILNNHKIYENVAKNILYPNSISTRGFLDQYGWYHIQNIPNDSVLTRKNIEAKVNVYLTQNLPNRAFSTTRYEYLLKTIQVLKKTGKVFLVRLPIHPKMYEIEQQLMPDFDTKIKTAVELSDNYLDFTPQNSNFEYTDGNHLFKHSAIKVSTLLGDWIKKQN